MALAGHQDARMVTVVDPQEGEVLDQLALKQQAANDQQGRQDKLKEAFCRWLALLASWHLGNRGALVIAGQTRVMERGALQVSALDRVLEAERAFIERTRLRLLDMSELLSRVSAQQRAAPPKPRGPNGAGGVRGASRSGSAVRDHHSCSVYNGSRVQNRVGRVLRPPLMRLDAVCFSR